MSNEISDLINQRKKKVNSKKNQIFYGGTLLIIALFLCMVIWKNNHVYALCWIIGIIIGIVIRYSRFCFASAFREPFLVGNTRIIRAIILALIISSIGFAIIQYKYCHGNFADYNVVPGEISSVGIHVALGAFIFGIGMIFAGGCACSTLMRIGEGHSLHWVVLLGFIIGTLLGAKNYPFWYNHIIVNAKTIYFFKYFDFKIVLFGQIIVLIVLYMAALWYENRHSKDM
ncbi:putative inner membrane protein [Clostridium tepidiprofundi DSM 19306]|uniref:Putative inner membrane protein n=1 Tax=Clostridium tepidiprofundi DSM 19306 TaxID=1121338 RepID=A0A151B3S4_9CLOT|nr:YeeE/YedE thiosulfate transporter family protein [Clostridium tepidiprofundi]KYH34565.1 putative inner membrane protein [Clostridium tepidiprofundi DSM 19306]